jgi:hypothetical protein
MKRGNLLLAGTFLLWSTVTVFAAPKTVDYDLEIYAGEKLFVTMQVKPQHPPYFTYSFSLYRVPVDQSARTSEGDRIYAFQIVPSHYYDVVKVEVLALLEDPHTISEEHPLDKFKKQSVGTYTIHDGESVKISEMSKLGAQPLTLKVVARS